MKEVPTKNMGRGNPANGIASKLFQDERTLKEMWQKATFILFGIMILETIGMFYLGTQPKEVPVVITVDPWGEAEYHGDSSQYSYGTVTASEVSIEYYLREYIRWIDSIYTDTQLVMDNWSMAFKYTSDDAFNLLKYQFESENPNVKIGEIKQTVSVESILKTGANSYQIDWYVNVSKIDGAPIGKVRRRGIFLISHSDNQDEEFRKNNPLGILINDFDIKTLEN